MAEWILDCSLQGDNFSPSLAEEKTGLILADKNEPGDIGKVGRYKNKPIPYGAATLTTSDKASWREKWNGLLVNLAKNIATFRECGADSIVLHHAYFYDAQCNMEFTPEELRQIADLDIPFTISCYRNDESDGTGGV